MEPRVQVEVEAEAERPWCPRRLWVSLRDTTLPSSPYSSITIRYGVLSGGRFDHAVVVGNERPDLWFGQHYLWERVQREERETGSR